MKILKTILFLLALLSLSACSANTISKPYDLAIFDGQRVVTFWVEKLYPGMRGEHNVIGMGYELSEDGKDMTGVYYLDPSPNAQDPTYGGLKKVTPAELLDAMLPCQEPNYAY